MGNYEISDLFMIWRGQFSSVLFLYYLYTHIHFIDILNNFLFWCFSLFVEMYLFIYHLVISVLKCISVSCQLLLYNDIYVIVFF